MLGRKSQSIPLISVLENRNKGHLPSLPPSWRDCTVRVFLVRWFHSVQMSWRTRRRLPFLAGCCNLSGLQVVSPKYQDAVKKRAGKGEQGITSSCLCCVKLHELSPREGNLCYPVSCTAAAYCQERIGESRLRYEKGKQEDHHFAKINSKCIV